MTQQTNTSDLYQYDEEFRDSISTVDKEGKRVWIYPKKPAGRYHNARIVVTVILLALLFAGPFITIAGQPLLLFNIFERKFIILGTTFWPQDFHLFVLATITFFVFIILFTVVFGRIWCGWACPQTLFMEMVFRKIEYLIEGDATKQRKLNQAPWNTEKILKKGLKQVIFLAISILIAHTLMAYLVGIERVKELVSSSPTENMAGFMGLLVFTGIFYWVFAYFREQACTVVCPYGRLQGVLLIKDSIVVAYDWLRGEPRKKIRKDDVSSDRGDCIDCKLCVHACPTGIDIRNGTQLECVNCTACIDACDEVMDKVGQDRGLIRYSSYTAIESGQQKIFTARVAGYSVILLALVVALSYFMTTRSDIEATFLRVPGMLYQETDDNQISNLYNVQFVNKTFDDLTLRLEIQGEVGSIEQVGNQALTIPANGTFDGVFFIKIPREDIKSVKTEVTIELYKGDLLIDDVSTNFLGPNTR